VVSLGGINSNQWDLKWNKTYVPSNGHIFSYVMSNIWNCNYALWQGGPTNFAYRVASHRGRCDTSAAARFGWGHAAPLSAGLLDKQTGTLPPDQYSAVSIDAPNVIVAALKRAEDGDGWIVRLYETGQLPVTTAVVNFNFISPRSASLTNLVEEPLGELRLSGSAVKVRMKSNELATIRIK
jgi:alpha-mannosidase